MSFEETQAQRTLREPVDGPIALVLAGGGARGAYEAGALSVLLPELERRGERPTLAVGTSVGAINAAVFAETAHLPAEKAATEAVKRWREVRKRRVIRPLLPRRLPLMMLRYAAEVLSVPGVRVQALLDPSPLAANLERWLDWAVLHENIANGVVDTLAVVASSAETGRSVVFVEHDRGETLPEHPSHDVDYVAARIARPHIEASAAIPFLFPPVRIDVPTVAAGWYLDGGTRLNTPIKPALELGAQRVLIISTDAVAPPPLPAEADEPPPDFGTGVLHLLDRTLVDPLIRDLRHLAHVNTYLADAAQETALRHYRTARGKLPYRQIPYLFVA
ncbi:MAG TPA: patatin-like phospholipase family protein, partial [Solirubrobacteraceae bacterium]|nr:patatin-like phospholipase family protein [Solirubrobacteraceae bacterium]